MASDLLLSGERFIEILCTPDLFDTGLDDCRLQINVRDYGKNKPVIFLKQGKVPC
jgi:hypothetical protein